jgi:uncharacterized protein
MRLYSGTTRGLVEDSTQNRVATKLSDAFFHHFRFHPPVSEVTSWRNSLRAVSQVFQNADLLSNGVLLELQLPLTSKRLDCLVTGHDATRRPNAVVIELKQWEKCEPATGRNEVAAWVGGAKRDLLHPSAQVGQYKMYLEDCHPVFSGDDAIGLQACSYLHNYAFDESDPIFDGKFKEILAQYPLFTGDDVDRLSGFMHPKLESGDDGTLVGRIEQSPYRASKKLLEHVAGIIRGKPEYVLLDEQLVAYDAVLAAAIDGNRDKRKAVIIVKGGPGTGKSVIALNLLGALSERGLNTHYVTGSRAFTKTIREIVGTRASAQIRYFNGYSDADTNVVDVLVCDEAHRIRVTSNSRFTSKTKRSNLPQIRELLNAGKTTVFLLDDDQVVRPGEIGSVTYIREQAEQVRCNVLEYELEAQFRCAGSDGFINWVNNTLGIQRTANVIWNLKEEFEFQIFGSPESLESAIRERARNNSTARMTAGFCWPWSKPRGDGTLVDDVVIGNYHRPWNARSDAGHLALGIPAESLWAYDARGLAQIGCVYTAQGFEFDYVGVIFGRDLVFDPSSGEWMGNRELSCDRVVRGAKTDFVKLAKNTYRVLLTRGLKGCFVHFLDKDTENFFRSRTENAGRVSL